MTMKSLFLFLVVNCEFIPNFVYKTYRQIVTISIVLCQNLKHPDDGYVSTPNNLTVGSKANYGCHPCYTLEGVSQRTCIVSGEDAEHAEWSDSAPTCIGK